MILLENVNVIVRNLISEWFAEGKTFDITCADFDGASFRVFATEKATSLVVALKAPAGAELMKQGGKDYLQQVYGAYLVSTIPQYDVTLQIPYPATKQMSDADRNVLAQKCATLKSYMFSSILLQRMEAANKGQVIGGMVDIPLRSQKERMFVKQDGTDRITVIFSIEFPAYNDSVIGQVFCTEFANNKDGGTPSCAYSPKAPSELKDIRNLPAGDRISFLTFVVYDRHFKGAKMEQAAFTITSFRNYLHYHLKCCKSYLHTRMRTRVENLLKVLNRAKQASTGEKKTVTGKTFTRK